jgi:hypothetical protein
MAVTVGSGGGHGRMMRFMVDKRRSLAAYREHRTPDK